VPYASRSRDRLGHADLCDFARARSGSEEDFSLVVRHYESLVFGFFRISAPDRLTESMNATQQLFARMWEKLGTLSKMADFERELVFTLMERDWGLIVKPADPRLAALADLPARDRIIALAVEIGNWSVDSAARARGLSRQVMERELLRIRCDLIGVHFINLSDDEKRVLREVSTHLCRDLSKRQRLKIAEATSRSRELRDFKSRCLEKRCEMVELWLDFRLSEEERVWLLEGVTDLIHREKEKRLTRGEGRFRWTVLRKKRAVLPV